MFSYFEELPRKPLESRFPLVISPGGEMVTDINPSPKGIVPEVALTVQDCQDTYSTSYAVAVMKKIGISKSKMARNLGFISLGEVGWPEID